MIHCEECGVVPVPSSDLPVELPLNVTFSEDQSGNPLASHDSFVNTSCPSCGGPAKRETDTMDTFYDSSWYFMRFCDANNDSAPFDREAVDYWMDGGVDLYIGGIEHAVMHLLYARFFTKVTRDAEMNTVGEPFGTLVCQGMLNAPAPFCSDCNAEFHVDLFGGDCPTCGESLSTRSVKMGKSLGNTVSPGEMVDRYGADTVRLFILFGANPEAGMDWSDSALEANHRQLHSIIDAIESAMTLGETPGPLDEWLLARLRANQASWRDSMFNVSIREGVMISHYEMLSDWVWYIRRGGNNRDTARQFLLGWIPMLAPATPHIAEEFWHSVGGGGMLAIHSLGESTGFSEEDAGVLAREAYLKELISSGRGLRELAERHTETEITSVVIQTSPAWKGKLAREAIRLDSEEFDFKAGGMNHLKSLDVFANEQMRGEVMQTWMALTMGSKKKRGRIHTWSQGEKQLILSDIDETSIINTNSKFIAHALGVSSVEAYSAGEGEDIAGKAKFASPLEPGIAFL